MWPSKAVLRLNCFVGATFHFYALHNSCRLTLSTASYKSSCARCSAAAVILSKAIKQAISKALASKMVAKGAPVGRGNRSVIPYEPGLWQSSALFPEIQQQADTAVKLIWDKDQGRVPGLKKEKYHNHHQHPHRTPK